MNRLIAYFGKYGLFADLTTVAIVVVGILSLVHLRREAFPNISWDVVKIETIYPGASAEETEKLITNPLEQDLKEIEGIKKMMSASSEGISVILLQLDMDQTTVDDAKSDIQDVVERFQDLPEGAEDPVVTALESGLQPVIEVSVAGELSEEELRTSAKRLEEEIEAISEVARVDFFGLRDFEMKVEAEPEKLRIHHVSLNELVTALQTQNVSIPAGTMEGSSIRGEELIIRTVGDFKGVSDIEETVVRANELAEPIRVKDVAQVTRGFEKRKNYVRANGKSAINLIVLKKEKADLIHLVDRLKERIDQVLPTLHAGLKASYINDMSYFVRRRLNVLSNNLVIGLILVVVLLSVLLPWRNALIAGFGIPFSFLGAIIIFNSLDISLSLISMMGLIIVVGMLVDDAIVVTENATRLIQEGVDPQEAAIRGTQQVWLPVVASVATTMLAFLPLMFMSGIMGKFIKYIPMGVILALLISLYECFFVLPYHVGKWVRPVDPIPRRSGIFKILNVVEVIWERWAVPSYLFLLEYVIRFRYGVLVMLFGVIGATIFVVKNKMQMVLFPDDLIEFFQVNVEMPIGTSLDETSKRIRPIEEAIAALPKEELNDYVAKIGFQRADHNDPAPKMSNDIAQIDIYLTPGQNRSRTAKQIIEEIREKVGTPPGIKQIHFARPSGGPPTGKPVNIGVRSKNYVEMLKGVELIEKFVSKIPGVSDLSNNYTEGKEEIHLKVIGDEAAAAGLSVASIGTTVRAAYEGLVATTIKELDEEVDVRVSLPKEERGSEDELNHLQVPNPRGALIPLSRVVEFERSRGIAVYEHEGYQRQVRITGDVDTKVASATLVAGKVKSLIPHLKEKFPGLGIHLLGENEDTEESMASLKRAFLLANFGIALILILSFGNLLQPVLVLLTIPLGLLSTVWTFYLHGLPFTFLGMIGAVALAGVVVNNAIVFIDFVNTQRKSGVDFKRSIMEAGRVRLRPIFLTSVTTTFGILPTAYGWGGLDPFVVPIALALGWGVFFGAILTTIIFPALLGISDDLGRIFTKAKGVIRRPRGDAQRGES